MAIGRNQISKSLILCVLLQIMANSSACNTAYVSFDGRNQQELRIGDRSVLLFRKRHSFFFHFHL